MCYLGSGTGFGGGGALCGASLPVLLDAKGTPLTPSLHPSDGLLQRCLGRALLRCCFIF